MREVRHWGTVPPGWSSAGIVDARAFTVGNSEVVHALAHAAPNRVRGECGVIAKVVETDTRRATWVDAWPDCPTCLQVIR